MRFALKVLLALAAMAAALYFADRPATWWVAARWDARIVMLSALVGLGVVVYFAALAVMGFRPRDFFRRAA